MKRHLKANFEEGYIPRVLLMLRGDKILNAKIFYAW